MTLIEAIKAGFANYATFTGRATRPAFWWWMLFITLVSAALGSLNIVTSEGSLLVGSSLSSVWSIAVLIPTLAVTVRRLRDAGRSWAELFWLLLPIVGLIVLIVHLCDGPRRAPASVSAAPPRPDPII